MHRQQGHIHTCNEAPSATASKAASAGRSIRALADLGRLLFFDTSAACTTTTPAAAATRPPPASATPSRSRSASRTTTSSAPTAAGPRNQRRTPIVVNTAFYPEADVERPLLRAVGRSVRQLRRAICSRRPKARPRSRPTIPIVTHLLIAQAHIPPTELVEVGGLHGHERHDRSGLRPVRRRARRASCPPPDAAGFRNEPIRAGGARAAERARRPTARCFGELFPEVRGGRADRLRHVRPRDRRVRVHAGLRRRADRPLRARRRDAR